MAKRILWLLNHTALREFEVPMLIEMGFEVYCPKIYQHEAGDMSASVTWEYDKTLSISHDDIDKLNTIDFYSEKEPQKVMDIMNLYFDIAVFGAFSAQVKMLVRGFRGILLFQAFGLDKTSSYTREFNYYSPWLLNEIRMCGRRFLFGAAYENLAEIENDFFKQRYVYLPIGLKKDKVVRIWSGGDPHILFISPKIRTNWYYHKVYEDFKRNYGDIPHYIGGAQLIPVKDDPMVMGFVPREQFDYNMRHLAAMYYHSQEPRHLHYHPLEAVANGMPLVFMAGGMLDELGGKNLQGRCKTVREAHTLLMQLSKGNHFLAEQIIAEQGILLKKFEKEYCQKKWKEAFEKIYSQSIERFSSRRTKKIGVILPQPYLGGVLDYTLRLIRCILKGAEEQGDEASVVFGYPDDIAYREKNYFSPLKGLPVTMRPFTWKEKTADWMRQTYRLMGLPDTLPVRSCYILEDGIQHFADCDHLILTADRVPGYFYSSVPYTVVAHDYIQRYVPELFGDAYEAAAIDVVRKADSVFVTTSATALDAVEYAGLPASKVYLTPLMFDLVDEPVSCKVETQEDYFIWPTNTSLHKNHKRAMAALAAYYHKGGKLNCVITGVNTDMLNVEKDEEDFGSRLTPYVKVLRGLLQDDSSLEEHIVAKGNLPKEQYLQLMKNACFVFHPGYADNGNGGVVDGVCLGVPTACSDYPAMRYMDDYVGLHAHFFDPFDEDNICERLFDMEINYEAYSQQLPTHEELQHITVDGAYRELYAIIKQTMGGLA